MFLIIFTLPMVLLGCTDFKVKTDSEILNQKISELKKNPNYVKIDNIDQTFLDAIVATEDRRFYKHGALDFKAIARATVNNVKAGKCIEGGSTITQQTAKNLCLTNERSFERKFKEIFFSLALEEKYSKREILEVYVNSIYFGNGYKGIKEATRGYFGKSPKNLTCNEATLLAGVPQAPSNYALNTKKGLKSAKKRQKTVEAALKKFKN
ncbi:transglycosylase domain-containing protein [Clostridium perfringens]|nr:transglycosylase domain-containing protein [Clostridium perfringens]